VGYRWIVGGRSVPLSIEGTLPVEFKLENNRSISRTNTLDVDDMEKNNVS
jgi:hypothetical protein